MQRLQPQTTAAKYSVGLCFVAPREGFNWIHVNTHGSMNAEQGKLQI